MNSNFSTTEAPIWQEDIPIFLKYQFDPSKWNYDYPVNSYIVQKALLRLRMIVTQITSNDFNPQHNGIWIRFFDEDTIGRTVISSGHPIANHVNNGRGWFLESLDLKMKISASSSSGNSKIMFQGTQPDEQQITGNVSSSSGFNVSGGMFGESPMATAGFSQNKGSSHTYKGVTFYNKSQESLSHQYKMTGTEGDHSTEYNSINDLVWGSFDAIFHHAEVRTPPHECFGGNLPIISQAFWTVPIDFNGSINIDLEFDPKWVLLLNHDTDGVGDYKCHWWYKYTPTGFSRQIDWTTLEWKKDFTTRKIYVNANHADCALLYNKWRSQEDLVTMSYGDIQNTLVVELHSHTSQSIQYFQSLTDEKRVEHAFVIGALVNSYNLTVDELKIWKVDQLRNALIVKINERYPDKSIIYLQGLDSFTLVLMH